MPGEVVMLAELVYRNSNAAFSTSVLLVDHGIEARCGYAEVFERNGFVVIHWVDDLRFRIEWEDQLKRGERLAVIVSDGEYVPYDLAQLMQRYDVSLRNLFPKLDSRTLRENTLLDLDFLAAAYERDLVHTSGGKATRQYIEGRVNMRGTAELVGDKLESELVRLASSAATYRDWFAIAELKARIDVTRARYGINRDTNVWTDGPFRDFVRAKFGQLTMEYDACTPVLVKSAMGFMKDQSDRFAIIVMDGMSMFDWRVIRESFAGVDYEQSAAFAMVPTVTSLSRQSLLSGRFPRDLASPWTTSKEKSEFVSCAGRLGFASERVAYLKDYDAELPYGCDCAAFVILDVDERVHGQYGGRAGMLRDMELLRDGGKLAMLVRRLTNAGMDVCITADHGNTPCVGRGRVTGTGVETETKSRRMLVVNDLADVTEKQDKYGLVQCPSAFLPQGLRYYVCPTGVSFDDPGMRVMSHGGMSIDEVIVPFITVRAGACNG